MPTSINANLQRIRTFLTDAHWVKTKYIAEHEYIVRPDTAELAHIFDAFIRLLNQQGFKEKFGGKVYTYFKIGDYRYWYIPPILNRRLETLSHDGSKRTTTKSRKTPRR